MAADIGIDATTSLDEAFAAAMERHGPDAKVIVLPFARYQLPRNAIRMHASDATPRGRSRPRRSHGGTRRAPRPTARFAARPDHRRALPPLPRRRGGPADEPPTGRAAHCGGAFNELLTMAADRHRNPRATCYGLPRA